jgi:hypothetical protein
MLKIIKQWLKKIFSDLHNYIIQLIGGVIVFSFGGAVAFSEKLQNFLAGLLQISTPLWLTILLVLLALVVTDLILRRKFQTSLSFKIKIFDIGSNQKWETKIYKGGHFQVDDNPICKTHDLFFLSSVEGIFCPEVLNRNSDIWLLT